MKVFTCACGVVFDADVTMLYTAKEPPWGMVHFDCPICKTRMPVHNMRGIKEVEYESDGE